MHSLISISFTLKGQDFSSIKPVIEKIAAEIKERDEQAILIYGGMPRHIVIEKGFSLDIIDTLDALFPLQVNCYNNGSIMRKKMAELLHEFGGEAHIIGEVKEGVAEEVAEYDEHNVLIIYHTI